MLANIEIVEGPMRGGKFSFNTAGLYIFGRGDKADCRLREEPSASRLHFCVRLDPPNAWLIHLGSRNSVFINRQEIGMQGGGNGVAGKLRDGDLLRVGNTVMHFHSDALAAESAPAAPAPEPDETPEAKLRAATQARRRTSVTVAYQPWNQPPIRGYDLISRMGETAGGEIYRAKRTFDGRLVAIKVFHVAPGVEKRAVSRFLREFKLTNNLAGTSRFVEFMGSGRFEDGWFLIFEFMEGGSLAQLLEERTTIVPPVLAIRLMLQTLEGLADLHKRGVVHRAIRPTNILFTKPDRREAKISDLGFAKYVEDQGCELSATGSVCGIGSPVYLAPELVGAAVPGNPAAVDVFSIAATFYTLLTNEVVYRLDNDRDIYEAIYERDIVPLSKRNVSLPPGLVRIIDKGIAPEPADRYPSAIEMFEELRTVVQPAVASQRL